MKFSIITMLGAVTPLLNAVVLAVRADELPGTLYFHNEQGVVAGRCVYPYAPEQLELLRSPPNNSTTDTLAKRGTNDLFFKSHTWVNCLTPDACTPPFFNLEGGICDRSSCENYQVQRFAWNSNPCHKTFNVPGTSYFVDNCDPNADWSVMPLSSREKGVLKVNGVCRGGCFAINYTYENGNCIKVSFGDAWNRITFCINA